jgi:DNA processing protein
MKTFLEYPIEKLTFGEKNYPKNLAKISKPPKQIYVRGDINSDIFEKTIAIVGTRMMTNYGKQVIEEFVSAFVLNGITVISGFMYGVDTEVHKKTIEYGGKTISVFGNGLDIVYPPENDKLYSQIIESGGIVVSEYDKDMKSQLWTYPARNRIVAGLATLGVLVIEADLESGSIITANLATKQGKKVWAIPGPITSKVSCGTNLLIKSGQAKMAITPQDILGTSIKVEQSVLPDLNPLETKIYEILARESLSIDEISRSIGENIIDITQTLTMMGLRGIVNEVGGKFFLSKS